jgi:hypothetical protein
MAEVGHENKLEEIPETKTIRNNIPANGIFFTFFSPLCISNHYFIRLLSTAIF